jgi:general transcription factor 3C polypeptide 5 (transcription factor C subunit 1)
MERKAMAPIFKVAPREIFAVEHPLVIKNLDNGIKTFGTNRPFERVGLPFVLFVSVLI